MKLTSKTIATMKNLFKSLMLVAVAAMTFTACEKDNNEANKAEQKTVIEFTAGFEDYTRSGFASEKDGENYKSVWYGNESIIAIVTDANGNQFTAWGSVDALPEGVDSSESAHFKVEFNEELPSSGSIEVFVGNWNTSGTATPNIGDEQGYSDYSVGSASHICKSNTVEYTNGVPNSVSLQFTPEVAFGKITMEQFEADAISEVVVTLNDTITYTLKPEYDTTMTLPVAWFACEAGLVVNSIAVTANVNGVEYFKSVEGLNVTFNKNKVRPINVTNMTEKPADHNLTFTEAEYIGLVSDWQGDRYVFVFSNNENQEMHLAFLHDIIVDSTLPVGTFEVGSEIGNNFSYFSEATFNTPYNTYFGTGRVIVSKSDDTYSVTVDLKETWVNGVPKSIKATFEGTLKSNDSGVDTTGYTLLTTGSHELAGSTLWIRDTNYGLNIGLYNGGADSTVIAGEYTLGGGQSIEGDVSGSPLLDGSKATIYNNGDGSYTVLLDLTFGNVIFKQTKKFYYTFNN